jgi:hypothetical protein
MLIIEARFERKSSNWLVKPGGAIGSRAAALARFSGMEGAAIT